MSRIAICGAIGDYADDTPLVRELLKKWDKRTLYFEAGVLVQGPGRNRRDLRFRHEMLKLLSRNGLPSSNSEFTERAFVETQEEEKLLGSARVEIKRVGEVAYVLDIDASVSKAATSTRVIGEAFVEIAGETSKGIGDMSLRTERDDIDLNAILRDMTPRFGSGGGHPKASGTRVSASSFEESIKALNASADSCPKCGRQSGKNDVSCSNCGSPPGRHSVQSATLSSG